MRYIVCGNTSKASLGRVMEAILETQAKLLNYYRPYGWTKGCRIEYLIELQAEELDTFKIISKAYIEEQHSIKVN